MARQVSLQHSVSVCNMAGDAVGILISNIVEQQLLENNISSYVFYVINRGMFKFTVPLSKV